VRDRNDGKNIIPTVIFPDGTHLSEPSNEEVAEKLGAAAAIRIRGYLDRLERRRTA
jgi:UDP:flavonoid glycosyltransferase YjiC (YdhE family)